MDKVHKDDIEVFIPSEEEKLEIIVSLINGDYTIEALRQDYEESKDTD